ncbi:MAG TPA: hypothetical protein VN799_01945 [Acidimicrobiales bacterium]|nr:hypothetical protein [Acidimicrobiales bacterium]
MAAHVDDTVDLGAHRQQGLVNEPDYLVAPVAQSHRDASFLACTIDPAIPPLKDTADITRLGGAFGHGT